MTTFKQCAEISPWQAKNPLCPFNCVDCEYFSGIYFSDNHTVEIECKLEDN